MRKGFHEAGVEDNSILIFSELMGSESLFLTANADTVYFVGIVDLTSGPMVVETPPQALGAVRRHVVSLDRRLRPAGPRSRRGRPVPARPARLRRPAARQRLPRRALAHDAGVAARPLVHGGRRPGADRRDDQEHAEALPLCAGRLRARASRRCSRATCSPAPPAPIPETTFVEGSGKAFNTIPPSDFGFFELLNEIVQEQPAGQHATSS